MNEASEEISEAAGGGGTRPNRAPPRMGDCEHKGTLGSGKSSMATDGAMTGSGSTETKGTI